ncbi:MAG: hypothetical protein GY943_08780 [Chloroflexi bacterium]|nr:hypothetical protein [Chloroflexota bacterium]
MNILISLFSWLAERLRDAAMWPINLVRDFPIRSGRLLHTFWIAIQGIIQFFPELSAASKRGEQSIWLRYKGGRFFFWWHRLINELFDFVGGPELGAFFFHLITKTTPLTGAEMGMAASVVGSTGMRFEDIRVAEGGLLERLIFKLNGNLAFATWHTVNLPLTGRHTREHWPLVMHELTHVYQYEHVGTRYLGEAIYMLIKTKRDCYNYGFIEGLVTAVSTGKSYKDHNREQQAMIVQDYCTLTARGDDTVAYEPFLAQLRNKEL